MENEQYEQSELCTICCEPMTVVAVGRCNHALTCALCTLRLRLCYRDDTCPFCKTQLKTVFLTSMPSNGSPPLMCNKLNKQRRFFQFLNREAIGVLVDMRVTYQGKNLKEYLSGRINIGCDLCDPSGEHAFDSFKSLRTHLSVEHNNALVCGICYSSHRYFPRDLEIFQSEKAFQTHMKTHPRCEYCVQSYFGKDELYTHMSRKHWLCEICQAQGHRHRYLQDARRYAAHLRQEHFVCNHPDCRENLIAFGTAEELEDHRRRAHSPRPNRPQGVSSRRNYRPLNTHQEAFAGYTVIDDDLPPDLQDTGDEWNPPGTELLRNEESFPPLPAASSGQEQRRIVAPREVYKAACPCGRRTKTALLPPGQTLTLRCDADCERQKRRQQLAQAFQINTATYAGGFQKFETAAYSFDLITWARDRSSITTRLEEKLSEFVLTTSSQRTKIEGVSRDDKKLLVELVGHYGLVGRIDHSGNYVEFIKTNNARLPLNNLTPYSVGLTPQEYEEVKVEALKYTMFVEDMPPGMNLDRVFKDWIGEYKVQYTSRVTARVNFRCERSFLAAKKRLSTAVPAELTITFPKWTNGMKSNS